MKLTSKEDLMILIDTLKNKYPKFNYQDIRTFNDARYYIEQLDLLVRSDQFINTLKGNFDLISKLSPKKQKQIIKMLNSKDIMTKYHELLVGHILNAKKMDVEFDKKFDNLTPDWMVSSLETSFICEVFTLNKYQYMLKEQKQLVVILSKLQNLKYKYDVSINLSRMNNSLNSTEKIDSEIKEVECFLMKNSVVKNCSKVLSNGLELNFFMNLNNSKINIKNISKVIAGGRHTYRIRKTIINKYEKYKSIANDYNLGFVIACISENYNRLNMNELYDVIFGNNFCSGLLTDKNQMQELSGILLIKNNFYSNFYSIDYAKNPYARNEVDIFN